MTYAWTIDKDYIDEDKGITGPSGAEYKLLTELASGKGDAFKMYDADGELYYSGRIVGDYEGFEPLDDFGTPNAGATDIHYKNKEGKFEMI